MTVDSGNEAHEGGVQPSDSSELHQADITEKTILEQFGYRLVVGFPDFHKGTSELAQLHDEFERLVTDFGWGSVVQSLFSDGNGNMAMGVFVDNAAIKKDPTKHEADI